MVGPGISGAPRPPPFPLSSQEAEGRRKLAAVLHQTKGGYVCCLPCSFSGSHETGWDCARAPHGRQGSACRARAWSGEDRGPLAPHRDPTWAPLPRSPAQRRAAGANAREGAGEPRWQPAADSWHRSRVARQRETRGCKLNRKFASCNSPPFVPLSFFPPPHNPRIRRPQDGGRVGVGRAGPRAASLSPRRMP